MALRTGGAGAHRYGLIALGIDSHAETRAARADADAYLSDLVLELRTDSAGLETRSEGLAGLSASATALLEVLEAGGVGNADVIAHGVRLWGCRDLGACGLGGTPEHGDPPLDRGYR